MKTVPTFSVPLWCLVAGLAFAADDAARNTAAESKPPEQALSKITVVETEEQGYASPSSTTASKTDLPNKDIPQSIAVRTMELMKDMGGPPSASELLSTVPGVYVYDTGAGGAGSGGFPSVVIRGFRSQNISFDGFASTAARNPNVDMFNVEQIEVLKGPSSVLYGSQGASSGMSGIVNVVKKRASAERTLGGDVQLGSWNFRRGSGYINGAVNDSKTVLLRLDVATEKADSFIQYGNRSSFSFAPTATFLIGQRDTVTLKYESSQSRIVRSGAIPATPRFAEVAYDAYIGNPNVNFQDYTTTQALAEYVHKFDSGWKLTFDAVQNRTNGDISENSQSGLTATTIRIAPQEGTLDIKDRYFELRVDGHVKTGRVDHALMVGYSNVKSPGSVFARTGNPNLTLNLFGPYAYNATTPVYNQTLSSDATGYTEGYFLQDLMTLGRLKVMAGVRHDKQNTTGRTQASIVTPPVNQVSLTDRTASYNPTRLGVVYQPTTATSLFAGYSTSWTPNSNTDYLGNLLPPELGVQYELGVKQNFSDRLEATGSLFKLNRTNISQTDPAHPLFRALIGDQESTGVEVDLVGQVTPALRLTAGYMHLFHDKIVKDANATLVGQTQTGMPLTTFNLFGVYAFDGRLAGLEVGGGVRYAGPVVFTNPSTFLIPSAIQWDVVGSYKFGRSTKVQLSVKNVFDRHNYSSSGSGGSGIVRETPRAIYLDLRLAPR